ncbi:MAG: hypothetical protein PHW27_11090 [Melioribacteraceae bacterium]|nr:hypothetical protein [Melioribacteraceae bacterium]MDD3559101.1 hypothetical protein [Melioribacteraceae bacterium]
MNRSFLLWTLAVIITLLTAYYQRTTGPTYPIDEIISINKTEYHIKLLRSHGGETDCKIEIPIEQKLISAKLVWKRFKTNDEWSEVKFEIEDGKLIAELPNQPPAGKLEYYIVIYHDTQKYVLPHEETAVIRFKGDVPIWVLIPHVIVMFGAMLLATRTGLEFFAKEPKVKGLTQWTLGFIFAGGLILGPITQYYAFDAFWTGFPFGTDLTDNKTLVAFIVWIVIYLIYRKSKKPQLWALVGAIITTVIYLIPHSMHGSELDYNELDKQNQQTEIEQSFE